MALWQTISNPDNKVSRQALRDLNDKAPAISATQKDWLGFLMATFPSMESAMRAKEEKRLADSVQHQKDWDKRVNESIATAGPSWRHENNFYPNALAFVKGMMEQGYIPEKTGGIGTVKLRKGPIFIGPMRNKHINAALKCMEIA